MKQTENAIDGALKEANQAVDQKMKETNQYVDAKREELAKVNLLSQIITIIEPH